MSAPLDALHAEIGVARHSDWMTVDQKMIDGFAEATLDRQFIHIDPVRAAQTPFGGTVAHGFLTLSLLPHLLTSIPDPAASGMGMNINYGLDRVRFIHPVRSGSRIRALSTLMSVEQRSPGQFQQTRDMTVEIEGQEKPALIATWHIIFTI
ncbi:MaoC domain protein dehydratase [Sphingobium chlorophenolicum L-1]|uniref:MaoC domain protein dehydratase n=1 Tax=Sphingobium chlorophenolicum L-1 TaxID=690566 RepID=F6ETZ0_SPHCR|nr:MaoC family dehydratase [Sphingobium chlorophenolicum]AEG47797.1 MaoC domain protein dehydratase [Sphingobium chlorophenolicum L-1]